MTPSRSFDMTAASAIFPWRSYLPYGLIVLLLAALPLLTQALDAELFTANTLTRGLEAKTCLDLSLTL